jgi:hypothetical protein
MQFSIEKDKTFSGINSVRKTMESLCDTVVNLSWGWQLVMAGTVLFLWKEVTMGVCTCSTPLHAQVRAMHCKENPIYIFLFGGIAQPQSQFPHSCVCERFIYSQDRSTYFPGAE